MCQHHKLYLANQKSGLHGQPVTALKLRQISQGRHVLEIGISAAESVPVACLEQFEQFLIDTIEHQCQYRNRMHEENCQQKTLK